MKGMFLKKCDIYYQKYATAAQRFQLSMTKLGACDEIRWNDGIYEKVKISKSKPKKFSFLCTF